MIKINYPKNPAIRLSFENDFLAKVEKKLNSYPALNTVLQKIVLPDNSLLTWRKLLTAPFEDLLTLNIAVQAVRIGNVRKLAALDQYTALQPAIAKFFMEQKAVPLSSCFYCNIDSVYTFSGIGDYKNGLDFIKRADVDQLQTIHGIGEKTANKIITQRMAKPFVNITDCPVPVAIQNNIDEFKCTPTHNHFTLDHFYHKSKYPYLSLCLYNFVPCCYACNSKLKGVRALYRTTALHSSPAAAAYSFPDDVKFTIYYHNSDRSVKKRDDFSVEIEISNNQADHAEYIKRLKIPGRYVHHKSEAVRLFKLKEDYPESMLIELSKTLGKSVDDIRKDVFGKELFESSFDNSSLVKYKRDIARNIKLLK